MLRHAIRMTFFNPDSVVWLSGSNPDNPNNPPLFFSFLLQEPALCCEQLGACVNACLSKKM
jgi:hypothetical protein